MSPHLQEIQSIINHEIRPANTLGFQVDAYNGTRLSLTAPLALNSNHHGTAFGGSLFSLAAVCGWGFVLLKLRESGLDGAIVVKSSSVEYLAPVTGDLKVTCGATPSDITNFIDHFKCHKHARLAIEGNAPAADGQTALRLQSTYTVIAH